MRSGPPAPTARIRSASTWAAAGVFVALFALALHYVVHYGTRVAVGDDLTQAPALQPDFQLTAEWLWSQHNEHRIPLARLVWLAAVRGTRDFRGGTLVDLLIVASVAAACMVAARRARGCTRLADAFFPLVWFSWLHTENMLNSFQVTLVLPSAILIAATLVIVRGSLSARSLAVVSACACAMPLCSLGGGIESVWLCAWLLWVGWTLGRTSDARDRRAAKIALAGAVLGLAIFGSTFVGYVFPPRSPAPTIGRALAVAAQFLASPLAWLELNVRAWPGALAAIVIAAGVFGLVRIARREPAERARSLGLVTVVLAVVVLALSIGVGRGGDDEFAGTRSRYALLALPWTCALFLAACGRDRSRIARALQWSLLGAAAWSFVQNLELGAQFGADRVRAAEALERDVARGRSYADLAADHGRELFYGEEVFHNVLLQLERAGFAPFERAAGPDANLLVGAEPCGDVFRSTGTERSSFRPVVRRVEGLRVLLVGRESVLEWPLPPGTSVVRGTFGVHPDTLERGAVRFSVTVIDANENVRAAFERVLDPARVAADRGFVELGLPFPPGPDQRLVVSTTSLSPAAGRAAWGCWTELRLR